MSDQRLEKMHAMAQRFSENGSVDQLTMRQIDALALNDERKEMTATQIKVLRKREHISQAVLATILNMSRESVQKWEQGKTKPQGAALRLLDVIDRKGVAAII